MFICRSRPTSFDADPVERLVEPRGSTVAGTPSRRWISSLDGRSSGSRRNSATHSASRSGGTSGTMARGGGGSSCCFFIMISNEVPSNGSRPVSAS